MDVPKFCCDEVIPKIKSTELNGFTEHHRQDEFTRQKFIFRSNPAYRSDSGQVCNVWYDWASFDYLERDEDEERLPAQILCFLNINDWNDKQYEIGPYAVVRNLNSPPTHSNNYKVTNQILYEMDVKSQQNWI